MLANNWDVRLPIGMPLRREAPLFSLSLSLSKFRQTFITSNKLTNEPYRFWISDSFRNQRKQDGMVYAVKKLLYIAFQRIADTGIVPTLFPKHIAHNVYAFMASFSHSAGKGVFNKSILKYRIKNAKDSMVNNSVSYRCLVYMSAFRIRNEKACIWSMLVYLIDEFILNFEQFSFQLSFKKHHVRSGSFAAFELVPC